MKELSKEKSKGITLIALVITIIVLLILAGVSIATLTGDNGILSMAQKSEFINKIQEINEQYRIYVNEKQIEEQGQFRVETLGANKTSLLYDGNRLEGNIGTILPSITNETIEDFEILKGKLYFKGTDEQKLKWALEAGYEIIPYLIEDGVLKSANQNLVIMDDTGTIIIPGNVTKIDKGVFNNINGLKKIIIPGSVKEIGDNAFSYNTNLEEVIIENGVEKIGNSAFQGCTAIKEIILPDTVTSVGEYCFENCYNLKNIRLSKNIKIIPVRLCQSNKELEEIIIPEGVERINHYAFHGCPKITTLNIPSTVKQINGTAFIDNSSLTNINISSENPYLIFKNGMLLSKDEKQLFYALQNITYLEMPNTVETIEGEIFMGSKIETIKISNALKNITGITFNGMANLKEIQVNPDNPNYMIENLSLYNKNKTTLIKYLGNEKIITLPEGLKRITGRAIVNNITEQIILPESLEGMDNWALESATRVSRIEIPKNVSTLSTVSFPKSAKLVVNSENLYFQSVDDSMIISKDGKKLCATSRAVTSFIIPNSVEIIDENAFYNNTNLREVTLSKSVKNIKRLAFYSCANLEKIHIPSSIENIDAKAFEQCKSLSQIHIDKEKNSVANMPWACPYGERAIFWKNT